MSSDNRRPPPEGAESPKQMLARHGLRAKKDWGQNFLGHDDVLTDIANACSAGPGDVVVELGAGLGHFTRALAATGARIVAVERDRDMVKILEAELKLPNVTVLAANAAEINFAEVAGLKLPDKPIVVGNLPYHISSPILFQVLDQRATLKRALFLLQKEVAERIAAPPGGKEYGLLSVLLQSFADVSVVLDVPSHLFFPPPKVDSAVVRIDVLETPRAAVKDAARFTRLVKAAFSQRRKTLWNSLRSANLCEEDALAQALAQAGVDSTRRAETLTPMEFAAIDVAMPIPPPKEPKEPKHPRQPKGDAEVKEPQP